MSLPSHLPEGNGNPLVGLAVAVIYAILYVLDSIRSVVTWVTISIPSLIVRILQYSLTISLGFPHLLGLGIALVVATTFYVQKKYMASYTKLKEPGLPPPSPQANLTELLPLTGVGLSDPRDRSGAFHNYLDDFLSAIRIFGYLEKPVFHELSRHLQTRRLAAGDTLEIGGGDFWCVVDGHVQVFVPSAAYDSAKSPERRSTSNGYHLLNEVSTGGTLSSLFSILSLFTEDVKLAWSPPPEPTSDDDENDDDEVDDDDDDEYDATLTSEPELGRKTSRANSDVSQMDEGAMSNRVTSPDIITPTTAIDRPRAASLDLSHRQEHTDSESTATDTSTETASTSLPGTKAPSPKLRPQEHQRASSKRNQSLPSSPLHTNTIPKKQDTARPRKERERQGPHKKTRRQQTASAALSGPIARATVDTTLAVIPAEAFRKLTKKFPKASGTIVQVVLERFSRVTFMTAHKFLGLTKEILKSESSLNKLVSHPLPSEFYTGGGMNALRARFQSRSHGQVPLQNESPDGSTRSEKDYFTYVPASPTLRAPSLPATTPRFRMTPLAQSGDASPDFPSDFESKTPKYRDASLTMTSDAVKALSPDTAARHSINIVRRSSAMRKQVAAGDLAMSSLSVAEANGGAYYRPGTHTPGFPRMDTWRGRLTGSTQDFMSLGGGVQVSHVENGEEGEEEDQKLREAVILSIAQSIGLAVHNSEGNFDSVGRSSLAPSVSAASTPNSPMFPHTHPGRDRSARAPFGNVLDMMNASHDDNVIGGMLREAAIHAQDDEASSMSMSVADAAGDVNRSVVRDLEGNVEILYFKQGQKLVKEGEKSPGIYYVIDGFLDVSIPTRSAGEDEQHPEEIISPAVSPHARADRPFGDALGLGKGDAGQHAGGDEYLFTVKPGGLAGYLASLCGTESYINITAKTDCFVGYLPAKALERLLEKRPIVLLTLAKRLISLLSPLVLNIDAALDWQQLSGGHVLYEKGEKSTDIFIVINGRLRALSQKHDGTVDTLREYGQNDSIGELDVITNVRRSDTVHAIRDTELVRIPATMFDALSIQHPATTIEFMRLIADRVRKAMGEQALKTGIDSGLAAPEVNLKTICVLGTNRSVPVSQFAGKLKASLEELGASTSYLNQSTVIRQLGRHAFSRIGKLKVAGWLADQEQHYKIVLYVADTPASSPWTLTCIRQADLVLILGMGDDPAIGEYEKLLLATKTTARKELILLHDERAVAPGSTRPWLKNRPWVHAHHHVELPGVISPHKTTQTVHDPAAIAAFKHLREQVETRIRKYRGLRPLQRPRRPAHMDDFARIARRICGKQVGIVLSGGGGRGISHIGMLQAMEENGIPVDAISGCSIGAFVGGLYAKEASLLETTGRTKQFSGRMGSMLRVLSDVTYPFVAYTTGHEFNRGIYKAFYDTHIEDCWIPFFANSTNITHSRMEVHRSGYAWRYVRASMTLAGLLPPLSDNGNLLVDGGYMNNAPIEPLRKMGIRDIFVIDVGAIDDTSPRNYGDSVSGWWIFINKFNPFYKNVVLSMTEISSRLAYVSSVGMLEDVKHDPTILYLAMPVQQFDTIGGFKKFSEVRAVGLKSGREAIKQWKKEGKLPSGLVDDQRGKTAVNRGLRARRMSI